MSRIASLILSVAASATIISSASAAITASWTPVTPATGAPSGYSTYDLMVTVSSGDDYASTRLFATGSFYQDAFGGNTAPNPALIPVFPALAYDTYVNTPGGSSSTLILGGFNGTSDTPTSTFTTSQLAITYGDTVNTGAGTFQIARVSYSGSVPTFQGTIYSILNGVTGIPMPQITLPPTRFMNLASASGSADVTVSGHGGGYEVATYTVPAGEATAGSTLVGFNPASPSSVLVALDFSGDAASIASVISELGLSSSVNAVFGAGFDAQITLDSATGGLFNLSYDLTGSGVTLSRVAVVPEPTALGLLGLATLPLMTRRRRA